VTAGIQRSVISVWHLPSRALFIRALFIRALFIRALFIRILFIRILLIALNLAAVTFFLLTYSRHGVGFGPYRIDLDVYRLGSQAWLRHQPLYGVMLTTSIGSRLPFTYPPFAAVLLSPLALVPFKVATTVLTLITIALTAVVLRLFLRSVAGPRAGSWLVVGCLLPPALFLEPVCNTLNYGQVNVLLVALVTLDCLPATTRWPRGVLTGLAAAVKLTPVAFVLFLLMRRGWRAAGTAVASFAVCIAVGFLLAPADSARYWTSAIFLVGRPTNAAYTANQCILAVLARAGLGPTTTAATVVWLALSAVVVLLTVCGMRRALAGSRDAWALSLNAFAILLISPISWSHHWVWAETGLLVMAVLGWRHRNPAWLAIAVAGLVDLAVAPQWLFPSGGHGWAWWQQVVGSSYVILAVVILSMALLPGALSRTREAGGDLRSQRRTVLYFQDLCASFAKPSGVRFRELARSGPGVITVASSENSSVRPSGLKSRSGPKSAANSARSALNSRIPR
jgi:alpha-1,2-mannosyltransferase